MNYFIKTSEQVDNALNELMTHGEVNTARHIIEVVKERVLQLYTDSAEEYPYFKLEVLPQKYGIPQAKLIVKWN